MGKIFTNFESRHIGLAISMRKTLTGFKKYRIWGREQMFQIQIVGLYLPLAGGVRGNENMSLS